MLHIALGTKAQVIKMAGLIRNLDEKDIPFNLIDLGQHSLITKELRDEFGLKEPDVYLSQGENISSLSGGIFWLSRIFARSLSSSWIRKKVFRDKPGICLIHGDTVSTLLGLYLAKRACLKVAHIEAGLRSYCLGEPFPEEIIRLLAMRFSDILFAPSEWAFANLLKMGFKAKAILLPSNTGLESLSLSLSQGARLGLEIDDYCLFTLHRMENIFSKRKLLFIVEMIKKIAMDTPVVFVQHQATVNQLKKFGLGQKLRALKNVYYFSILSHGQFVSVLKASKFVITDGGSIQEESFYLDKPCLLLRNYTERIEGLGENVVLSKWDRGKINGFLKGVSLLRRKSVLAKESPSALILRCLTEFI